MIEGMRADALKGSFTAGKTSSELAEALKSSDFDAMLAEGLEAVIGDRFCGVRPADCARANVGSPPT